MWPAHRTMTGRNRVWLQSLNVPLLHHVVSVSHEFVVISTRNRVLFLHRSVACNKNWRRQYPLLQNGDLSPCSKCWQDSGKREPRLPWFPVLLARPLMGDGCLSLSVLLCLSLWLDFHSCKITSCCWQRAYADHMDAVYFWSCGRAFSEEINNMVPGYDSASPVTWV